MARLLRAQGYRKARLFGLRKYTLTNKPYELESVPAWYVRVQRSVDVLTLNGRQMLAYLPALEEGSDEPSLETARG